MISRRDSQAVAQATRFIGPYAGKWICAAREVRQDDEHRELIALAASPALAQLIVAVHNLFLPLRNALYMAQRKLADRRAMDDNNKE
jgi:hypothetical protein